ncbi:hypothetical protein Tco_0441723 [Tanacetum coccineum]
MNDHECSPFTNCRNHIHETYTNTNIDANYNPYLDVSRTFNNHEGWNDEEAIREEGKPNDDHVINNFNNDLVGESPVCKFRRFKVINYSFRPAEKYIAIKECEYDDLTSTNEEACHAYQGIFRIMDEGLSMAYPSFGIRRIDFLTLLNENDNFGGVFIF